MTLRRIAGPVLLALLLQAVLVAVAARPARAAEPENLTRPTVSGPGTLGTTLTADPGTWTGEDLTFAFQWLRDGDAIAGATGATYEIRTPDVRTRLAVRVTATDPLDPGAPGTATSERLWVPAVPTSTMLRAPERTTARETITLRVRVRAGIVDGPTGTLVVYDGATRVKDVPLRRGDAGSAEIPVKVRTKGVHRYQVRYAATGPTASSRSERVTVVAAPAYVTRARVIGRSVKGRAIRAWFRGDPEAEHVLLLLGQMHGDEPAGPRTAWYVRDRLRPKPGTALWVVPTMNPDGAARHTRRNARGVDLNRNWPTSGWTSEGRGGRYWGGPRPASEPETKAMIAFLRKVKPDYIASIHQPLYAIGISGQDVAWEKRLARNLALPRRHLGVGTPAGKVSPTLTGWYNSRLGRHGVATTIEYGYSPSTRYVTEVAGKGILRAALVY